MKKTNRLPKTYTLWSILTCVLVSLPVGLIALYYGSLVKSRHQNNDHEGALQASKNARSFSFHFIIIAFLIGMAYSIFSGEAIDAMRQGANAYNNF